MNNKAEMGQPIEGALNKPKRRGVDIAVACERGVCGTCVTRVLEGTPEHRDHFLSDDEKAGNDQFTPCCSRARTPLLVLDL